MRIGVGNKWFLYIGRDFFNKQRFEIIFRFGFNPDADLSEIPWHHRWEWSCYIPHLLRRGGKIVGFCAFGRCHIIR